MNQYASERRAQYLKGMRLLVSFYENHPDMPAPSSYVGASLYVADAGEFLDVVKAMGGGEKSASGDTFMVTKSLDEHTEVSVSVTRTEVCTARKVGTKTLPAIAEREVDVMEYDCPDSLLAKITQ